MLVAVVGGLGVVMAHYPMLVSGMRRVQSDLGDNRFNNYMLEHAYLWLGGAPGHSDFWSPPFFFPARNIAAYSDVFLSVAPIYGAGRKIGLAAVAREGADLTVVSHSFATVRALRVAEKLAAEKGVSIEVIDLRSLRPLDVETVAASVAKTNRALCVEEGWPSYGVSAELAARIQHACFDDLDAPVERVGMAEVPLPYAKELELAAMPTEDRIERAALRVLDLAP